MTENKGDLISRETLSKSMRKSINERYISWTKTITVADIATLIFDEIDNTPTVEPEITDDDLRACMAESHHLGYELAETKFKRPQGEWIKDEEHSITINMFRCSNCNGGGYPHFKYCPHCGADMQKNKK